jgi:glutamyl-tRNA synthetase
MSRSSRTVKTRFAPSPTGYLHIGGARTAIFNWLYARKHGGSFLLRIEDTDTERSTDDSIRQIIDAMSWLGIDYEEGPYRQTERQDRYQYYVNKLIEGGKAYRCVCSNSELDSKREEMRKSGQKPRYDKKCRDADIGPETNKAFVVRFKTPETSQTTVTDLLRGEIVFNNEELDDMIIMRTNGSPTYNLCVVVDDVEMGITHVIRGDDHLANTPRQSLIYDALGFEKPALAHVSMILGADGKRLSKRHGALSVLEYKDLGFLPESVVNYLARLGWSHGNQELFSIDELKTLFDLDSVGKSSARFDIEKLTWVNSKHMISADLGRLSIMVVDLLKTKGIEVRVEPMKKLLPLLLERASTVLDLVNGSTYFFSEHIQYQEKAAEKFLKKSLVPLLEKLLTVLSPIDFHDKELLEREFKQFIKDQEIKLKDLAQPLRVAITGGTVSPGLFDVMAALGKEKFFDRINDAVKYIKKNDRGNTTCDMEEGN